jgi:hypothetical protein
MVAVPANSRSGDARIARREAGAGTGLAAAVAWAIGLVVGVFGLLAGHAGVVIAASVIVVVAPLLGVAWASYGQRRPGRRAGRFVA